MGHKLTPQNETALRFVELLTIAGLNHGLKPVLPVAQKDISPMQHTVNVSYRTCVT